MFRFMRTMEERVVNVRAGGTPTIRRTHPDGKDFSGIMHAFEFAPERPITLTALTFFGVHHSVANPPRGITQHSPRDYFVTIKVTEMVPPEPLGVCETIFNSFFGGRTCIPVHQPVLLRDTLYRRRVGEEDFTIALPAAIPVCAMQWIKIEFQLDGPPMEFLNEREVYRTTILDEKSKIMFHTLIGCSQLKGLQFFI